MPFLVQRLLEYFSLEIILSAVFALLFDKGIILQTRSQVAIIMSAILVINAFLQFYCLREYLGSVDDIKVYFKVNLTVLSAFAVLNLTLAFFSLEPYYTYLFLPYKLGMMFGISKFLSAVIINVIMLIIVIAIPFFADPRIEDIDSGNNSRLVTRSYEKDAPPIEVEDVENDGYVGGLIDWGSQDVYIELDDEE